MKILFISKKEIDYLANTILHGLVCLYGDDVVDFPYIDFLCESSDVLKDKRLFSLRGTLPDRSHIDRSNIEQKIREHYFDLVVYGSSTRNDTYLPIVLRYYKVKEVIMMDGEDNSGIVASNIWVPFFKRELQVDGIKSAQAYRMFPISFSIPESLFRNPFKHKERLLSFMNPEDPNTYIYGTQEAYFDQYQQSMFAITTRKNGWDCMRHYEIIAAGCLPVFENFNYCPKTTMVSWPADLQIEANCMYNRLRGRDLKDIDEKEWTDYWDLLGRFQAYAREHLTTKAMARYMIQCLDTL